MEYVTAEQKLIDVHRDESYLATLYDPLLFPKEFGVNRKYEGKWLNGRIPKGWSVEAVILIMDQWIKRNEKAAQKFRIGKGDAVTTLNLAQKSRELCKNGLVQLMSNGPN